jgi:YVTN family beta-propeller protein
MRLHAVGAVILCLSGLADAQTCTPRDSGAGHYWEVTTWDVPRPLAPPAYANRAAAFLSLNGGEEGDLPREVALTPDGSTAVIVNMGTTFTTPGTVTFADLATRTIEPTVIEVGVLPVQVAISPDGQHAAVPNVFSHSVSVIHVPTRALVAHVPVTGTQPFRCAITPDSRYVVTSVTNDAVNTAFSIIDLTTMAEVASHPAASQGAIGGYATPEFAISGPLHSKWTLTPDGSRIVLPVSGAASSTVYVYDRAGGAQLAAIPAAANACSVDVSRDGAIAVIGHEGAAQRVSVIDLSTLTLANSFPTGQNLFDQLIRVTPTRSHAIAVILNAVIFVNLSTGAVDATLSTGTVGDIEFSSNDQWAFLSNFNSSVIDLSTRTVVRTLTLAACVESAASPVDGRVVALNSRFREDIHFYTLAGAASSVDGRTPTGPAPEGDCAKTLAVTPDGRTLVAAMSTSRNLALADLASRTVTGFAPAGDRVLDIALTPDGRWAVACNGDDDTVSIIDLQTGLRVAHLPVASRPAQVEVSPDGTRAYVLTVAGTDLIHFINLAGAASAVIGTQIAGQTGSGGGYTYTEISGITLSPNGSLLAVCRSFDDMVRLIDTSTRAVVADVAVGDFPMRIGFNPAGTRAWVSNAFGNSISVVDISGAASATVATVPGIASPLLPICDPAAQYVYVNNQGASPRITVIDAATHAVVANVALAGGNPRDIALDAGTLYVAGADAAGGKWYTVSAAGPASALLDSGPLAGSPYDLVYVPSRQLAIASQPGPDGVDLIDFTPSCDPDINRDGNADQDDVAYLINVIGGGPDPLGIDPDFNRDGNADQDDVAALINVVAGGTCP